MEEKFSTIYLSFENAVKRFPDKVALVYLGETFTYSRLGALVDRLARALYHHGVRKGDRVIIYLSHCPQWVIIWLALQKIGAIAVPITHFYGPKDLEYIANDSGAETIFCMDTNFGHVSKVLADTGVKMVVVTTAVDFLPGWKKLIGKVHDKIPTGSFVLRSGDSTFLSLLKDNTPSLPDIGVDGGDTAEILYTGGTLGTPKGVPIPNTLFVENSYEMRRAREGVAARGEDIIVQGAPLYHMLGQVVGLGTLFSGDTVILLPKTNLDAIFDHIQRYKATSFFGTPTMYRMILEHDRLDYYDLGSLRYCLSGGDVLPQEVAKRWERKLGKPISQGYGATEAGGVVALTYAGEPFPEGTTGKAIPFQKVMLIDPDTLEPVSDVGELVVSSEHMVRGYWKKPEETASSFVELDGRLWYRTGDIMRVDAGGWCFFVDRTADVIKHKGYRVSASKIDAVLQEHPAIVAACTIGVPDEKVGERIKAFVIAKEDVKGINAHELITWCHERLAPYEVPSYIEFRDMLPKSKVGKLLRRELRAEERRKFEPT
ncbi:MAG: long-chain fatty acid--CoA ligase [Clostridia bacterium]|nr:MAG: long-chain fatty acid--CoA ligase [Clostridia bacterium]